MYRSHVLVCGGTGCTSSGSEQIIQTLKDELKKNKLQNEVAVVKTGCHGLCAEGPVMIVYPEAVFYSRVRPESYRLACLLLAEWLSVSFLYQHGHKFLLFQSAHGRGIRIP